jgi:hypothetical protein
VKFLASRGGHAAAVVPAETPLGRGAAREDEQEEYADESLR